MLYSNLLYLGLLVKTFRLVRKKQPQPRLNQPTDVNVATILPEYPLVETQRPNETPPKPAGKLQAFMVSLILL